MPRQKTYFLESAKNSTPMTDTAGLREVIGGLPITLVTKKCRLKPTK